jgi:hypothetical protein
MALGAGTGEGISATELLSKSRSDYRTDKFRDFIPASGDSCFSFATGFFIFAVAVGLAAAERPSVKTASVRSLILPRCSLITRLAVVLD